MGTHPSAHASRSGARTACGVVGLISATQASQEIQGRCLCHSGSQQQTRHTPVRAVQEGFIKGIIYKGGSRV